uniref:Nidogen 2a (osteonidogen) n=1 Tax=Cyprinus carpio TaxID=7962 RepID=A0A8C1XKI3_CYPCA
MTWDKIALFFLQLSWTVQHVTAIHRHDIYPYGMFYGDVTLQEGDDETSEVTTLTKPMYFYETSFTNLYVATNGIISTQDLPMEKQYVDDGFPTDFPVIAPFLADIDTSKGKGSIFYRQTESPTVLKRAEADVKRGFPDATFTPTHAFIATWENVSAYEEVTRSSSPSSRINTFQVVLAYNEKDTYALFLYPEDGLQFFGTRPKESYNVEIELPARVGFTRGELSFLFFSRTEGPYYSVTSNEQSVKNLYQKGNIGEPGVWLFHIGNRYSFQNVIPAQHEAVLTKAPPVLDAVFPDEDYTETDEEEYDPIDPDFQDPSTTEFLEPEQDSSLLERLNQEVPLGQSPPQPSVSGPGEFPPPDPHNLPSEDVTRPQRPLPKHAILQVYPNRVKDVPPHASGGQVFSVEEKVDFDSGVIHYSTDNKETCERFQQQCSQNAHCTDYSTGFCCHCSSGFYGNGRHCLPNGAPHRVNGKVRGTVLVGGTAVQLDRINLHAYIVVGDGRAYTAISEVPEPVGWALMPMAPIGGLFGWLFALELPNSLNGFSITGAEFTRHADVTFYPGNQRLSIVQTAMGLDNQNYLNVDTHLQGSVPFIPPGATVQIEPFKDTYHYYPSLITSTSVREFTVVSAENGAETHTFQVKQNITYRDCNHGPRSELETQELRMERIFVMYVKEERILRYAITNKIGPLGDPEPEDVNPCYSGNHDCDTTAQCVPAEGQLFLCQCATGYRGDGRNCYDVDECAEGLSSCGAHSYCMNLPGSHRCQCESGFKFGFDGRTCQVNLNCHNISQYYSLCFVVRADVDECRDQPCHTQALCSNSPGSFQCQCRPGYHGDGFLPKFYNIWFICIEVTPTQHPETVCERWRASLLQQYGGQPESHHYLPQCDSAGEFNPVQCYGDSSYCWCVDQNGREVPGTRSHDAVKPACIPTVAPPTMHPLPRPDVTPPPTGTSLLYAQGQQIGVLPLNGTQMDKQRSSVLLALHGSIVVGIDYDCRERKVYWSDLAGRTISRANNLEFFQSLHRTLYWTDWNREAPKIESSSVDGQNRRVLVQDGIGLPNALTYDSTTRQVCWADAGTKRLECISPNGTGRRVVHSDLSYPFSMVAFANHYYYTDWRRDGVIALSRDKQSTDEHLPDQRSHLYGITVAPPHCL